MRQFGEKRHRRIDGWVKVNTSMGEVLVTAALMHSIRKCRENNTLLVTTTSTALYDSFIFPWKKRKDRRPSQLDVDVAKEILGNVMIATLNDPDAGPEADDEFERQLEKDGRRLIAESN